MVVGCNDAECDLSGCTFAITVAGCGSAELAAQLVWNWLSSQYGEDVFMSCGGLCCFWNLKSCDLLTFCDLSFVFFGLVLYSTKKFHCLIQGQKVSVPQVFNLGVELVAE